MLNAVLIAALIQNATWQDSIDRQGWIDFGASTDNEVVILLRDGGQGRIWARFENQDGNGSSSSVGLYEVNCTERTFTMIQGARYERRNLQGPSVNMPRQYTAQYPTPGSFGDTIVSARCDS